MIAIIIVCQYYYPVATSEEDYNKAITYLQVLLHTYTMIIPKKVLLPQSELQ